MLNGKPSLIWTDDKPSTKPNALTLYHFKKQNSNRPCPKRSEEDIARANAIEAGYNQREENNALAHSTAHHSKKSIFKTP